MVSDRDRAIREETAIEIMRQLGLLTVMFDTEGPIYRYETIERNVWFVIQQLNGDTANPPSSL